MSLRMFKIKTVTNSNEFHDIIPIFIPSDTSSEEEYEMIHDCAHAIAQNYSVEYRKVEWEEITDILGEDIIALQRYAGQKADEVDQMRQAIQNIHQELEEVKGFIRDHFSERVEADIRLLRILQNINWDWIQDGWADFDQSDHDVYVRVERTSTGYRLSYIPGLRQKSDGVLNKLAPVVAATPETIKDVYIFYCKSKIPASIANDLRVRKDSPQKGAWTLDLPPYYDEEVSDARRKIRKELAKLQSK